MGARPFLPKHGVNQHHRILLERYLLEKHYSFLKVNVKANTLICYGCCQPTEYSVTYMYKVKFTPNEHPKVYVLQPVIEYNDDIHMYASDNRLCLFYPKDFSWTSSSHLHNTIIPWTHEWFLFYERFQISGIWEHPFVPHNKI